MVRTDSLENIIAQLNRTMTSLPKVIGRDDRGYNPHFVEHLGMSNDEMREEWSKNLDSSQNFAVRDSLIEAMVRHDVRPNDWIRDRNVTSGLYPNSNDPDFAYRLSRKTEFASLRSDAADEDTCTKSRTEFETTAIQRLVARFLHPSTPYRGILLNHGVGVGKTCSAITVAETFLEAMPHSTVYILAPQAIAEGFKKTIFDSSKLIATSKEEFKLTGERWKSPQCTGMTYLRLTGMTAAQSREEIDKEVEKVVRRRYKIMGYLAFANAIKKELAEKIPKQITGQARKDREHEILMDMFSDRLIIIDEAHNLRDADASEGVAAADEPDSAKFGDAEEGKALTPVLRSILTVAEGLRLMLMTATPMYNTAPEIVFLLNLLTLNDTKNPGSRYMLTKQEVFNADGTLRAEGEEKLVKVIKRYLTYMRGENPNTFPLRLNPAEIAGKKFVDKYPSTSISRREGKVTMTDIDKKIMAKLPLVVSHLDADTPTGKILYNTLKGYAIPPSERPVEASELSDFILDQTMQMSNITYPNSKFGTSGWDSYMKAEFTTAHSGHKIRQFVWKPEEDDEENTPTAESIFGEDLYKYAPKMNKIIDSITKASGMSFVYSRYVKAGALPLAIALELRGWCRVLADGKPSPLLKQKEKRAYKHYYVLLTSDETLSPNFKGLVDYATSFADMEERYGKKVKAILGSQVASEGLDLKCIRELHLLDGWYHLNRIEQIMGRGVRYCSHAELPPKHRNCLIYLHVASVPTYETADLYAYRLAVRKAQPIGRISRLIKINSWDCLLNIDAILLKDFPARTIFDAQNRELKDYEMKDIPYTYFCDFSDTCEYSCFDKPVPKLKEADLNLSTYESMDFRRKLLEKQKLLTELYATEDVAYPVSFIKNAIYEDIPWSVFALHVRELLGKVRIKRKDGIYGTLLLLNDYLVFQPSGVTASSIPLAMRYGRAYGHLARAFIPKRGALFEEAAPVVQVENVAKEKKKTNLSSAYESALASLKGWDALVSVIMAKPTGYIEPYFGLPEETFKGWRWILHHFGSLPETRRIALAWWMDNVWSFDERKAVFSRWIADPSGEDASAYANLYTSRELFFSDFNVGLVYEPKDATNPVHMYCDDGAGNAKQCVGIEEEEAAKRVSAAAPIVDRKNDTGPIFGFLTVKQDNVVFKSVEKSKGSLDGAECSNTSNLRNHEIRIKLVQDALRAAAVKTPDLMIMVGLLLNDDEEQRSTDAERKKVQEALKASYKQDGKLPTANIAKVSHLSLKQACPYMEFLLRWMDMKNIDGKRWFLSVIDIVRTLGAEKAVAKQPKAKKAGPKK